MDNRNTILAIALSVLVLIGWQYFFARPQIDAQRQQQATQQALTEGQQGAAPIAQPQGAAAPQPGVPGASPAATGKTREAALKDSPRIPIDAERLHGSIALVGGRVDDVTLKDYRETVDPTSPEIVLFAPLGSPQPYYAEFGFVNAPGGQIALPNAQTEWKAEGARALTSTTPVTLTWDNGQGLTFRRTIAVDKDYLFTVKDAVTNAGGGQPATLYPYALISRHGEPHVSGYYILHEGLIGVLGADGLQEFTYKKITEQAAHTFKATGGWFGITDKYWAATLAPPQDKPYNARFAATTDAGGKIYQTDYLLEAMNVAPGATAEVTGRLFAGAKQVAVVDRYENQPGWWARLLGAQPSAADGPRNFRQNVGGWLGITDKYWASALVPPQDKPYDARFASTTDGGKTYQTDYLLGALTVAPGASAETSSRLFAGAKQVSVIDKYEKDGGVQKFELLIDWGWFHFITKPMFYALDFFYKQVGNFGIAILIVTVILKLIFFPLANKSYVSMSKMKLVQPEMARIKERFGDDKAKQQQALMELYKKEKINPLAGCLPIVVQIPVFFALYKVLFITIEMRHAPFFGWIHDLAAPDPTSLFNLFGALPYDVPHFLMIGVWPLIMGVTMFVQMRLNPLPQDPAQALIFTWMPLFFTFLLASFPAGLVIYWSWNNSLSIAQQYIIMRRQGVRPNILGNIMETFRRKKPADASKT